MAQGEQGGGDASPPREATRIGPSPGAQQAAREQVERSRQAAEERERERASRHDAQPPYGQPPQPPLADPGSDPHHDQQPPPEAWPPQGPSQPGQQQPPDPSYQPVPPGYAPPSGYGPPPGHAPAPGYAPPPGGYAPAPGYGPAPGWGQTPYGYAPVPYGHEYPQAAQPPAQQRQQVTAPPDEHPKELPWRLAGWWSRVGAQLIDLLIVWVPIAVVLTTLVLLAEGARNGSGTETTLVVVAIVATFVGWAVHLFYAPLLMKRQGTRNGQTWGKQVCNIRVIRADGEPMRFADAALRQIIYKSFGMLVASTFVPLFPWILNYLWPTWDEQHRALHDLAADTRVVAA